MNLGRQLPVVILCATLVACNDDPPTNTPPPSNGERITGNERIGWDQPAANATDLASFRYAIYVDGTRSELTNVTCSTTSGPSGFACTAALPSMTTGAHTLEIAAFVVDGAVLESGKSTALRVERIGAAATSAGGAWQTELAVTTTDQLQLRLQLVTDGVSNPTDLAFAEDGRIFVAEQAGLVRIVREDQLQAQPALALDDVTLVDGRGGLLALTLDPQFRRTGFVYLVYTGESSREGLVFRVARFRETGGRLAQKVVLLEGIPATSDSPSASLHFGPDGKLYAAFDDGGDEHRSGDLASFNGKVLRLNPDGSTPADQAGATPVFLSDLRSPRGFDWRPAEGTLWVADAGADESDRLHVFTGGAGSASRSAAVKYALPRPTGASDVAFYRGEMLPAFRGDLLVAADEGQHILRLRFDARRGTIAASERLLHDRVGPVRVVGIGMNGEIYFGTPNELGRIVP
ncbi:MAG TPA: PQQ-dependent sugar dehydrogenase [Vicinamibacterales bacterium]|jgi:glucose/arabinose dehydrogenase